MKYHKEHRLTWDDLFMIGLALASALMLIIQMTMDLTHETMVLFDRLDIVIALIFLAEFLIRLNFAKSKKKFLREKWWYALAAIPMTINVIQTLRLMRLLRLIQVLRVTHGIHYLIGFFPFLMSPVYLLGTFIVSGVVMVLGSVSFYAFEHTQNPHVENITDSVVWSATTLASVGYTHIYPTTLGGEIVGSIVIITGLIMIGALTLYALSFRKKKKR